MNRICFLGKYPPLEGGTAVQGLWLVRMLALSGIEVDVVSTGHFGGLAYSAPATEDDWAELSEMLPEFLRVHRHVLVNEGRSESFSIPVSDSLVTRLSGLAVRIVNERRCEFILGSYLEPYGMAALMASQLTGIPFGLAHAGSDITRLVDLAGRRKAYLGALQSASAILSSRTAARRLRDLNVDMHDVEIDRPVLTPPGLFTPAEHSREDTKQVDLPNVWIRLGGERSSGERVARSWGVAPPEDAVAVVMVGKVGVAKGSFWMLDALALLVSTRPETRVHLVFVTGAHLHEGSRLLTAIEERGLAKRVWCTPFLLPWQMPELYRCCDVVAFLETDFSIDIHRPQVPREVAQSGTCLLISSQVAQYQQTVVKMRDGVNCYIVEEPRDPATLSAVLSTLELDEAGRIEVARAGRSLYADNAPRRNEAWVKRILDWFSKIVEVERAAGMTLEAFHAASMRVFADRRYREALSHDIEFRDSEFGGQLSEHERSALEDLIGPNQRAALERYCSSLLEKKFHFLAKPFAEVLDKGGDGFRTRVHQAFVAEWILTESSIPSEFSAFEQLLLASLGDESSSGMLGSSIAFAASKARAMYSTVLPSMSSPEVINSVDMDFEFELAPSCEIVVLSPAPVELTRSGQETITLAILPDPDAFGARVLVLSRELGDLLRHAEAAGGITVREALDLVSADVDLEPALATAFVTGVKGLVESGVIGASTYAGH